MSLETRNISKYYGKQKALDDVCFSIEKGELVGFLGPNGAGKSTLMKIITGFLPPDAGEVFTNGEKMGTENLKARKIIGYLPENNPLYTDLYVKESLEITAGFYGLENKKQRVAEMVDLVGLAREQHKKIGALSKGYRQRVGLAQALIHDPEILILDEPTTGLDPNQLEEIRGLIRKISTEKTVMLSSHIMQEVEAVCSRAIIINKGKIVADGAIGELKGAELKTGQIIEVEFLGTVNAMQLMELQGVKNAVAKDNHWEIEAQNETDIRPVIFRFAVQNHLVLLTLKEQRQNLGNIFQQLTQ